MRPVSSGAASAASVAISIGGPNRDDGFELACRPFGVGAAHEQGVPGIAVERYVEQAGAAHAGELGGQGRGRTDDHVSPRGAGRAQRRSDPLDVVVGLGVEGEHRPVGGAQHRRPQISATGADGGQVDRHHRAGRPLFDVVVQDRGVERKHGVVGVLGVVGRHEPAVKPDEVHAVAGDPAARRIGGHEREQ
jgi:hypothetical protein